MTEQEFTEGCKRLDALWDKEWDEAIREHNEKYNNMTSEEQVIATIKGNGYVKETK